jgi:hypothetical protein
LYAKCRLTRRHTSGLPDGIFSSQKFKVWLILLGVAMEDFSHLVYFVYFTVIWCIFPFLVCCTRKIWQPWSTAGWHCVCDLCFNLPNCRRNKRSQIMTLQTISSLCTSRVPRWFILRPKNSSLGIFWRVLEWKMWVYFMDIWYNVWPFGFCLWSFGIFFPFWYVWTKKNLAFLWTRSVGWFCSFFPRGTRRRRVAKKWSFKMLPQQFWLKKRH